MPTYRATLAYNARAYRVAEFEAANDDAARAHALTIDEWPALDCDSNGFDDASCRDAVLMLDETHAGRVSRTISDEIKLRTELPYGTSSQVLVRDARNTALKGEDMHVTSYDICVRGAERLRSNNEILLPIMVSNETSSESILEAMNDEIQGEGDGFNYDAAKAALAAFWAEDGRHIMHKVRDLEPIAEADAWTADAYCHLWIYLCVDTTD